MNSIEIQDTEETRKDTEQAANEKYKHKEVRSQIYILFRTQ